MSDGHSLLLAFDTNGDDDVDFCRGFEAGRLWTLLERDEAVNELVHAGNAEMVLRMAEAKGRAVRCEEVGDDWLEVYFSRPSEVPH